MSQNLENDLVIFSADRTLPFSSFLPHLRLAGCFVAFAFVRKPSQRTQQKFQENTTSTSNRKSTRRDRIRHHDIAYHSSHEVRRHASTVAIIELDRCREAVLVKVSQRHLLGQT